MAISFIKLYFLNGLINLEEKEGRGGLLNYSPFVSQLASLHRHEIQVGGRGMDYLLVTYELDEPSSVVSRSAYTTEHCLQLHSCFLLLAGEILEYLEKVQSIKKSYSV